MSATAVRSAPTLHVNLGDPRAVAQMLAQTSALASGHFELLAGGHSDTFVRFSRVAAQRESLDTTARWLLPSVSAWMPDVVAVPTTAGVALAATLANRLGLPLALADVGEDGRPCGFHSPAALADRRVLLVNDVVTTGDGVHALAKQARDAGAVIAGATWFLARGEVSVSERIEAPTTAIGELGLAQWSRDECPLCAAGADLTHAAEIN